MKFAFFKGCRIPKDLPEYELSTKVVLNKLGVELVDIEEFNCCGYPVRHLSTKASILSTARNIALARRENLDILTPCKCCYGNLMHSNYMLQGSKDLKNEINLILSKEGLRWEDDIKIKHLLYVLSNNVGIDVIKKHVKYPLTNMKIAAHYGCHALRPGKIVKFDNPLAPTIFENLIQVAGAKPVDWSKRLDCCGNPLWGKNNNLSLKLMREKIEDAKLADAEYICTACSYCHIQFDMIRKRELKGDESVPNIPAILYPQLLGLAMGIDKNKLGF
ncbi:MAG: CoB--CoM heterodisulfide reductase iron-sulfur subunit B family protein [Desulfobacterales bacterium]|nr:CoB--CoM heterodisulfide reductase iron-sulfur subunit B family protein [Desulfobacterales bacterium]MBF0397700.1 CoB--CoM heterodisulfide reductase iron-sulfur subunit B family protein [Desulfobacterales bacterium]